MLAQQAMHVVAYDYKVFRKSWRGALFVSVVSPLLFLSAMGLGLGGLVRGGGRHAVDGVSYLTFIAPGLLATTTMQTAAAETTYPIMGRLMWNRTYEALLNTPMRVLDLVAGEMLWLTLRLVGVSVLFLAVAAMFGAVLSPLALLSIPVATLTGLAFGTPIFALSGVLRKDNGYNAINRFIVIPLFLLGGAFFPISQLPRMLQGIAWMTPLTHGVALCRDLLLGTAGMPSALAHLAVLCAYIGAGLVAARISFWRRLVV
jgi:lipooligosaccharide transport system permease protein